MIHRFAWFLIAAFALGAPAVAANAASTSGLLGFQNKSADPIQVNADSLEVYDEGTQRVSMFKGGVVVTRGGATMKSAAMKVFSSSESGAVGGAFTRIEAEGGIWYSSGGQLVTGDSAIVDNAANTITVNGNVVYTQNGSVITGNQLVVDMTTGRAKILQAPGQQIRGIFTPGAPGGN